MATDHHAGLTAALDALTGPYAWGVRDCLRTAEAVAGSHGHEPWLAREPLARGGSERRAMARAIRAHGSMAAAYDRALAVVGPFERLPDVRERRPGDMVVLSGVVRVAGRRWVTAGGREVLGVVGAGHETLVWVAAGLRPVRDGRHRVVAAYRPGAP
ncbi:hypothetical protein [Candidatus Palauibacter sp.]|uniref:hypothetical protein n=1 Tax=Candidatus Palauibacter sp. TaxID=3101350 RepID=UPI003CC6885A